MSSDNILLGAENAANLERLMAVKGQVVPFIGAGFSVPACPGWARFLDLFMEGIQGEFLGDGDVHHYMSLKQSGDGYKYEKMADFLVSKAGARKFSEELSRHFKKAVPLQMIDKYHLLHRVFPGLKITTNFDCLLEDCSPGENVFVSYGTQADQMERLFTRNHQNSLLKIHGGFGDMDSIVLDSAGYDRLYGSSGGYLPGAPLPSFLERVFTNCTLLFMGCSLVRDRVAMIMEGLGAKRPHFAIMKRPGGGDERAGLNRRLSNMGVTPIWVSDYVQVEEILGLLAERWGCGDSLSVELPGHDGPFVGRTAELAQIGGNLEQAGGRGSVQVITGRFFSIEGAGGVGKTTLAIEAARRFSRSFPDGVLGPVRVDEHTPISFAVHLARLLRQPVVEPVDVEAARELVGKLLMDRQCLLILDNAADWVQLKNMLPRRTASTLLITTRFRDMFQHLRLKCKGMGVHLISLEKFSPQEALELFREMLGSQYREADAGIYGEIAKNLGFLPIALRQAISLMVFRPHYGAVELRDRLCGEERLSLLRKGEAAGDSGQRVIDTVFDLSSPLLSADLVEPGIDL